jgi:hypothetical protein
MLSIVILVFNYAECGFPKYVMLGVITLSIFMLNIIMRSIVLPNLVVLSVAALVCDADSRYAEY